MHRSTSHYKQCMEMKYLQSGEKYHLNETMQKPESTGKKNTAFSFPKQADYQIMNLTQKIKNALVQVSNPIQKFSFRTKAMANN